MIECHIPYKKNAEKENLLKLQKRTVQKLLAERKILQYSFSGESNKLWILVQAHDEMEALDFISGLPLACFLKVQVYKVDFQQTSSTLTPEEVFSLN
jgi:hypothetical protein